MKPRFVDSFLYAAQGIRTAVREERNMRFHLCAAFYVYLFSLFYGFGKTEYILITLMVCGVLALELVNSSLERTVERPAPSRYRTAGVVKDMAAGAVLLSAIAALLVGVVILFRPELWALLWGIVSHPAALGLLALSLAVAAGFVFLGPAWVAERWDALRRRRLDRGRREK